MNRTSEMLVTLKKYLKAKGITYRRLAGEMGLSETSVKRLFSEETFSMKRLEEVCRVIDLDFYDLVMMARRGSRQHQNILTLGQEQALAVDSKLLTFFYFLVNGWTLAYITAHYEISDQEVTRMLTALDRMGLIELHPANRFRLLVSQNVFWRKGGPLWQLYQEKIMGDFLDHAFELPGDRLMFSPGVLSQASMKIILKKIDDLTRQFNELAEMDAALPIEGRYSCGLVVGFRPWVFSMIADLRRRKPAL